MDYNLPTPKRYQMNMKKQLFGTLSLSLLFVLAGCNDYDMPVVPYETPEEDSLGWAEAPTVDPAWQLTPVTNVGQNDDNVFLYRDDLYNALFTCNLGWNGGDVVSSTSLADGNTLWLVRDSYFGTVNADSRARKQGGSTVRSSLLLQTSPTRLVNLGGYIQTTDPEADGYYQGLTIGEAASTKSYLVPALAAQDSEGVKVLFGCYKSSNSRREASYLNTYAYTTEGTLTTLAQQPERLTNMIGYDDCLWKDDDGHNYILCNYLLSGISGVLVARTATHDLNSTWEYWVRTTTGTLEWTTTAPTVSSGTTANEVALRSSMLANNGACQHPQLFKQGDWYYLVGQAYQNGQEVLIWRSQTPHGPFSDVRTLCVVPSQVEKKGSRSYNALTRVILHTHLSREGEIVFSTAQTAPNTADNYTYPGSADFVRPWFYRVYNWQSLWD